MPNQDQNLNYGWHTQKLGNTAGQTGYSQVGAAPPAANLAAANQPNAGFRYSPSTGMYDTVGANVNPGYAASGANMTPGPIAAPSIPATTVAAQNPSGLSAQVNITGGTVTVIAVAPAGSSNFTTLATSTPATVTVPPGGQIKMTYSVIPTGWTWTGVN